MKHVLSWAFLFLATTALAQQQLPPTTTPPTFPEGRQSQAQPVPPDTAAPPTGTMSSDRVEAQILDQLKAEPRLSGNNIAARVGDNSVVLTGNVATMEQRALAVRIAQSNAGNRKIVDKIKVKQQN